MFEAVPRRCDISDFHGWRAGRQNSTVNCVFLATPMLPLILPKTGKACTPSWRCSPASILLITRRYPQTLWNPSRISLWSERFSCWQRERSLGAEPVTAGSKPCGCRCHSRGPRDGELVLRQHATRARGRSLVLRGPRHWSRVLRRRTGERPEHFDGRDIRLNLEEPQDLPSELNAAVALLSALAAILLARAVMTTTCSDADGSSLTALVLGLVFTSDHKLRSCRLPRQLQPCC